MGKFLLGIGSALKSLQTTLVGFGALGLFGIALLDAALIPLPGGADAIVMALSHLNNAMMPVYVLAAVGGSTLGCLVPYYIGRAGGERALSKFSDERRQRVNRLMERYGIWAMIIGAVLPPPFPFKVFLVSAGVFRMNVWRFLIALAIGRGARFILEGVMAVRYGDQAAEVFKHHYPKIGLGIAAVIIIILLINSLRNRGQRDEEVAGAT